MRHPQSQVAPVVMAVLWNGFFAAGDPLDPEAVFAAQLDLIFGPAAVPAPGPSG